LWCCSWLLALLACTRESSSWRNFTGRVSFSSLKSMLGLGHVNMWSEEPVRQRMGKSSRLLDGPWFGACFDYFWLIESCYLLIEQVHSVLAPLP
jgi:hypothetical protein